MADGKYEYIIEIGTGNSGEYIQAATGELQKLNRILKTTSEDGVTAYTQTIKQADGTVKEFTVSIQRAQEAAAQSAQGFGGALNDADIIGTAGVPLPERYDAWAKDFRGTHVQDEVTGNWRKMTDAEQETAVALDNVTASGKRATDTFNELHQSQWRGLLGLLAARSAFDELVRSTAFFNGATKDTLEMFNLLNRVGMDSMWVFMGVRNTMEGMGETFAALALPTATGVTVILALGAALGDLATQEAKTQQEFVKLSDQLDNLNSKALGLPLDQFRALNQQLQQLQQSTSGFTHNLYDEFKYGIGAYWQGLVDYAHGATPQEVLAMMRKATNPDAQTISDLEGRSHQTEQLQRMTDALKQAEAFRMDLLKYSGELAPGDTRAKEDEDLRYAKERERISKITNEYQRDTELALNDQLHAEKLHTIELQKQADLEKARQSIVKENQATQADVDRSHVAEASRMLEMYKGEKLSWKDFYDIMEGLKYGVSADTAEQIQQKIRDGWKIVTTEEAAADTARTSRYRETEQYLKGVDRQSRVTSQQTERAFFAISDGLMSAWSAMANIWGKSDAHAQRVFQTVQGIEGVIHSIVSIVDAANTVSKWLDGGTQVSGLLGGEPGKPKGGGGAWWQELLPVVGAAVSWFGDGGVFNSPSVIGIGERGTEAVVPLDRYSVTSKDNPMNVHMTGTVAMRGNDFVVGFNQVQNRMKRNGI